MKQIFVLVCMLGLATGIFAQDHVQWRGANRDGIYNETGLLKQWPAEGPKLLWSFEGLGPGHASATVTNTNVFTAGTIGEESWVFKFSLDGKLIWKSLVGKEWVESYPGVRTTPMFYNGKLYIMTAFGEVVCMNAETGKHIWKVDLMKTYGAQQIKWGMTENLLLDDNKLYCVAGGEEANVLALNPENGALIWKCKAKGEISAYNSPVIAKHGNRKILLTQTEKSILGIDAQTGAFLWSHDQPNRWSVHANTPLYFDGKVFCVSGYGKGNVMLKLSDDGSKVTELWRDSVFDNRHGGWAMLDGIIYGAGDASKVWVALDANTGKIIKQEKTFGKTGNTIAADGMVYGYSETGEVGLIDPNKGDFKLVSKFKVPLGTEQHWAHLVIAGKRLYVRHGNALMVYDIAAK